MRGRSRRPVLTGVLRHYLKGAPAPDWLTKGVPRLKMEEHLKERAKPSPASKTITTTDTGR